MSLTVGSLFSGIGGLDLGLERAGMAVKWQVEIDDYCNRVLAKHWPDIPRYRDVRTVGRHNLESVDLICGGFPCQDVSVAGKRAGINGERSGLWREFIRIIGELRPRFVLVENVPGLFLDGGIGRVLGDLAEVGYDAEWSTVSACALDAPHTRERVFIVAYPKSKGLSESSWARLDKAGFPGPQCHGLDARGDAGHWTTEPGVGRMAHGVPGRVDRLRSLGNAVVPQVAEWIGRRILAAT